MLKQRSLKKIAVSLSLVGTMLLSVIPGIPSLKSDDTVSAASTCNINLSKTYQSITGFGGINHPEWTGADLSDAQRKTAFGNGDNQLGFTVLRIFVNPDSNQWSKAVPTAKYASEQGVTVFASPWEPPSSLAESGGSNGKLHLPKSNYTAYAQHLNNFGTYMKNNGVDLYAISVQNEPDYASEWTYWSTDETTDFLANYADKITSTRVMSPESFQYSPENASWINNGDGGKKFYTKILNNAKAFANTDLFGTHFYGTTRDWMDFPALENSGKPIWMTEVYVPNSEANSNNRWPEALQVSENIHNGLVVGNISAYVWWYIRRNYGPINEDGTISKRGYCMAQYSKYVRPGAVRVDCTEQPDTDVLVSAYKNTDGKIAVVAINKGSGTVNQAFNVGTGIKSLDSYRTSASENLKATNNMSYSGSGFTASLPGNSVTTFVVSTGSGSSSGSATTAPSQTQPSTTTAALPSGCYFHDTFENGNDSWTAHGTAEAVLSGRYPYAGTNALLAQNRGSSWCGLEKKLDTSVFKAGSAYSFSVNAVYLDGTESTHTFSLTLQYNDSSGTTKYANIASASASKGSYALLENKNFTLPAGSDYVIYVESPENTDNFYIDEAIAAKSGTSAATTTTTSAAQTTAKTTSAANNEEIADTSFADGSIFSIKNANSNLFMRASGEQSTYGNILQVPYEENSEMMWRLYSAGGGYYYMMSAVDDGTGYSMYTESTSGGNIMGIYPFEKDEKRMFKFVKNSDGSYKILTKLSNDSLALGVKDNSTSENAHIIQTAKSAVSSQNWILEKIGEPGLTMDTGVVYTLKNAGSGKVMDISNAKMENGTNVIQYSPSGQNWQKWTLEKKSGLPYYYIRSVNDSNYVLTVNGTNVEIAQRSSTNSMQFFKFVKNIDGTYTIISRTGTGALADTKVVETADSSSADGADIRINTPDSTNGQKWTLVTEASSAQTTTSTTKAATQAPAGTTTTTTVSTTKAQTASSTTKQQSSGSSAPSQYMEKVRDSITNNVPASATASGQFGELKAIQYFSSTANRVKKANVLLPEGYDPGQKYPVMYVNHGIFGDQNSMLGMGVPEIAGNLARTGEAEKMIIVFTQMYSGTEAEIPSAITPEVEENYDKFLDDLTKDLMPYIEQNFSVKTGRENTAISGFSMGGRETLYIGISRPDLFGYIGAACPAPGVTPGDDYAGHHAGSMSEDEFKIKDHNYDPYILMITGGTNDGTVGSFPESYHNILTKNGQDHIWQVIQGGGHDNSCVVPMMYNFIRNIFKTDSSDPDVTVTTAVTKVTTTTSASTTTASQTTAATKPAANKGDINGDGKVGIDDAVALQKFLSGKSKTISPDMDINGDGKINVYDLIILSRSLTK